MLPARLQALIERVDSLLSTRSELFGDPDLSIVSLTDLAAAPIDALGLYDDPRHLARVQRSGLAAVLTTHENVDLLRPFVRAVWAHPAPREALWVMLDALSRRELAPGVHPSAAVSSHATVSPLARVEAHAVIDDFAVIEEGVRVGAGAVIERGVIVGAHTVIGPRVVLAEGTRVGARCRIDAGSVLGALGFGYLPPNEIAGVSRAIAHIGGVLIEDDAHVGALTTVARGTLSPTRIGRGARVDSHVHIGHNVSVGEGAFLAGQVGLAGSVTVGPGAMLGGKVGVGDHLHIGAGARVAGGSGVTSNVPAGEVWGGYPARERTRWLRATAWLMRKAGR